MAGEAVGAISQTVLLGDTLYKIEFGHGVNQMTDLEILRGEKDSESVVSVIQLPMSLDQLKYLQIMVEVVIRYHMRRTDRT